MIDFIQKDVEARCRLYCRRLKTEGQARGRGADYRRLKTEGQARGRGADYRRLKTEGQAKGEVQTIED